MVSVVLVCAGEADRRAAEIEESAEAGLVVLHLRRVVGLQRVLLQLVGAENVGGRDRRLRRRRLRRLHLAVRLQGGELVDRRLLRLQLAGELLLGGGVVEPGVLLPLRERLALGGVGEAGLALVLRELLGGGVVGEAGLRLALAEPLRLRRVGEVGGVQGLTEQRVLFGVAGADRLQRGVRVGLAAGVVELRHRVAIGRAVRVQPLGGQLRLLLLGVLGPLRVQELGLGLIRRVLSLADRLLLRRAADLALNRAAGIEAVLQARAGIEAILDRTRRDAGG